MIFCLASCELRIHIIFIKIRIQLFNLIHPDFKIFFFTKNQDFLLKLSSQWSSLCHNILTRQNCFFSFYYIIIILQKQGRIPDPESWKCMRIRPNTDPDSWKCMRIRPDTDPDSWKCMRIGPDTDPDSWKCMRIRPDTDPDSWKCMRIRPDTDLDSWKCMRIRPDTFSPITSHPKAKNYKKYAIRIITDRPTLYLCKYILRPPNCVRLSL